jgi:hypothetical protein
MPVLNVVVFLVLVVLTALLVHGGHWFFGLIFVILALISLGHRFDGTGFDGLAKMFRGVFGLDGPYDD